MPMLNILYYISTNDEILEMYLDIVNTSFTNLQCKPNINTYM